MAPTLNLKAPHTVHTEEGKVSLYDQNGFFYDGVTKEALESLKEGEEWSEEFLATHAMPKGGVPVSKETTPEERFAAALATLKAANVLSSEDLAKFGAMLNPGGEQPAAPEG